MNQTDLRCTEGKWKVVLWIHYVDGQSCFISETMLVHILHILQEHDTLFIYYRCLSYHPGIKDWWVIIVTLLEQVSSRSPKFVNGITWRMRQHRTEIPTISASTKSLRRVWVLVTPEVFFLRLCNEMEFMQLIFRSLYVLISCSATRWRTFLLHKDWNTPWSWLIW